MAAVILVVEDQPAMQRNMRMGLTMAGYEVVTASDGVAALAVLGAQAVDLVLADIAMPRMNGYELYEALRRNPRWALIPFVFVSARALDSDVRYGKQLGADDYLVKPFQMEELLARLAALLRRSAGWASPVLHCGPIALDTAAQTLTVSGQPVALTAFEYRLLQYLMLHAGEVASKAELTEHLYDEDADRDSNVLEVLVGRLRRKLDPEGTLDPIETLRGRGYRFRCETAAPAPAETPVDV